MRCSPVVVAALFALPGCIDLSQDTATSAVTDPPIITLLHVNDTHSHLASWGPKDWKLDGRLGGLTKAASLVAREKALDPNALFVHAGDLFHGDLFFNEYLGVPELLLL
ncbi:MAG TPA: metallophosphoesterase, partial [Kofleriaceae bacterium]|nr:metallophosphoesterase [Kofleriaceae bacterium]